MNFAHWTTLLTWIIALASILLMLFRPRNIAEYIWISLGAVVLVVTRLLPCMLRRMPSAKAWMFISS